MEKINLAEKLALFEARWQPHVVAGYNGNDVMVVKVEGAFPWHDHPQTDDPFLCLSGRVAIDLPDRSVELGPGELVVVPAGVCHRPRAENEAHLMLIEPAGTPNTGDPATAVEKPRL